MEEEDPGWHGSHPISSHSPAALAMEDRARRECFTELGRTPKSPLLAPVHLILSKLCKAGRIVGGNQGSERRSDSPKVKKGKHSGGARIHT